jgi:uncharacterized membrane protein YozB (DUF420 family)
MYEFTLIVHNWLRWIVVIIGIVAAVRAWLGWLGGREWMARDRQLGSWFGIAYDLQLLIGLILYFALSPITISALRDFGAAMSVADLRYYAVEHVSIMLAGLVFVHLGSILARRAATDRKKFQWAAIFFTLAVLTILAGMPWMRPLLRV